MSKALFHLGRFVSHAGAELAWKIDCDALGDDDWRTLARLFRNLGLRYGRVLGIPRGGMKFAAELRAFVDPTSNITLIADDVLTTGRAMEAARSALGPDADVIGVVAFARRHPWPGWVFPLFSLHPLLDHLDDASSEGEMP